MCQHHLHQSFVAHGNKLTATPHAARAACHNSLPFRPANKQIYLHPHCTVIIYDIYCIFTKIHTVLHVSMIEFIPALAVLSRITTMIINTEQTRTKVLNTLTRSASSPLQVAPARSSSSITYIFYVQRLLYPRRRCVRVHMRHYCTQNSPMNCISQNARSPRDALPSARPRPSPYAEQCWGVTHYK